MEDKSAVDQLMEAARELCASSKDYGVDTRSALAGGALGMLLSSKHGRGLVGKVIKYGAVAGLGALAWQASRERERKSPVGPEQQYEHEPSAPGTVDDDALRATPPNDPPFP
ncbi:Protein of unknown function [Modicisalibacter muralis]|uniref:Uncharacterized protein n=1 Tax=Modicisalibacter muralis TaxID=119000 RepID=A0A1G9MPJ0_9GAMM|nr:DUF533 domain-containing protein [Halomonas muralis]SDL75817.1 Protein of unknown function [Halomonas muralis]